MKTPVCHWTEVEKREEISRVLFRRNRVGNGEEEGEEEQSTICRQCPVSRKKN